MTIIKIFTWTGTYSQLTFDILCQQETKMTVKNEIHFQPRNLVLAAVLSASSFSRHGLLGHYTQPSLNIKWWGCSEETFFQPFIGSLRPPANKKDPVFLSASLYFWSYQCLLNFCLQSSLLLYICLFSSNQDLLFEWRFWKPHLLFLNYVVCFLVYSRLSKGKSDQEFQRGKIK